MNKPFISICIPAYKRVHFLKRLLDSIAFQIFKNFEVIITDDSDDDSVGNLLEHYYDAFSILYTHNPVALGTPANWNACIKQANGEWIKLMHDDDWFTNAYSLSIFAKNATENKLFIFSSYNSIHEDKIDKPIPANISKNNLVRIEANSNLLFVHNYIGPPSVTLIHKSIPELYNESLKWWVDIEYYMRIMKYTKKLLPIKQQLINIWLSKSQVTQSCINNPAVELPEGYFLISKYGTKYLKNIWIYDAWWRLFRNMNIKDKKTLHKYVDKDWPDVILRMIKDLSCINDRLLGYGFISKSLMVISYLKNWASI